MKRANQKGQGSIELVLVAMAIVVLGAVFTGIYLQSQDSTIAMVIAKNRLTETFNQGDTPIIVDTLRYTIENGNEFHLQVETIPKTADMTPYQSGIAELENAIANKTSYAIVAVSINCPGEHCFQYPTP